MEEKYLPIGTIVRLQGAAKKLMITGFCSAPTDNPDQIFDYSGCIFPEGLISTNQIALFNHNQIDEVSFKGFVDDEEQLFKKRLNKLTETFNTQSNIEPLFNKSIINNDNEVIDIL